MSKSPLRVASLGMGWWSDVLADAIQRSSEIEIASCFTRSREKRDAFAKKYGCAAAQSYEQILSDPAVEGIINTTPNDVHLETTRLAVEAYQDEQGRLPESLGALVPNYVAVLPPDGFDGKPVRFSRERRQLWSEGDESLSISF